MIALFLASYLVSTACAEPGTKEIRRTDAASPHASGRRVAVIIGVETYGPGSGIPDLDFPDEDALGLARVLIESGSFAREDVILMTDGSVDELRPTGNNIRHQLARLKAMQNLDLLFVYYSGHGIATNRGGKKVNYILPYDASSLAPETTGIAVDELVAATGAVDARVKLLVMDACRSLPDRTRSLQSPGFEAQRYAAEGTAVIFGAKFGEPAYDDPVLQHGAFTAFLIDGLRGAADGWDGNPRDGLVSLREVYGYVQERLAEIPRNPVPQSPWINSEDWNGRDIEITAVPQDMTEGPCPSTGKDLDRALSAAIEACNALQRDDFRFAWLAAKRALRCLEEPLQPDQAARWHMVDALYQLEVRDDVAAERAWRAGTEASAQGGGRIEVPQACQPDAGFRQRAAALSLVTAPIPEAPRSGRVTVDGSRRDGAVTELPNVIQLTWDRSVAERPVLWEPGQHMPVYVDLLPPPIVARHRTSRMLMAGATGAALAAGGMLGAGLVVRGSWFEAMDGCIYEGDETSCEVDEAELRHRANRLGVSAAVAGAVALGLGGVGLGLHGSW